MWYGMIENENENRSRYQFKEWVSIEIVESVFDTFCLAAGAWCVSFALNAIR